MRTFRPPDMISTSRLLCMHATLVFVKIIRIFLSEGFSLGRNKGGGGCSCTSCQGTRAVGNPGSVHPSSSSRPSSSTFRRLKKVYSPSHPRYPQEAALHKSTSAIPSHRLSSLGGGASERGRMPGCKEGTHVWPRLRGEGLWMAPSGVIAAPSDTGPRLGPCGNPHHSIHLRSDKTCNCDLAAASVG